MKTAPKSAANVAARAWEASNEWRIDMVRWVGKGMGLASVERFS
jgi:hypothetical protein